MKQVSKNQFFDPIIQGGLDVHPRIVTARYPYTSLWEFPRSFGKPPYGKTVDRIEGAAVVTDYFVSEEAA